MINPNVPKASDPVADTRCLSAAGWTIVLLILAPVLAFVGVDGQQGAQGAACGALVAAFVWMCLQSNRLFRLPDEFLSFVLTSEFALAVLLLFTVTRAGYVQIDRVFINGIGAGGGLFCLFTYTASKIGKIKYVSRVRHRL